MKDQRILITGATGQVARHVAEKLAKDNEVWAAARFSDPDAKAALESSGIKTVFFSLGEQDLSGLPDVDYVIHCAANTNPKTPEIGILHNADGTGFLMQRYKDVKGFLHMSSTSVYRDDPDPEAVIAESATLGGYSHYSPHYAMSKLAGEAVAGFQCRALNLPTVIARLDVAYGEHGHGGAPMVLYDFMKNGWPYQSAERGESFCRPIHQDDIADQIEAMLDHVAVPAPIVNLAGDEVTSMEEIARYIEELTGLSLKKTTGEHATWQMKVLDVDRRNQFGGPCHVKWKDGVRTALLARHPDAF
ncbi:MAG: nucleoside-diphosphate-sugar epimerase [Myxococcota bacterium]|jgi:nucleoside-diphosphate-sugar epimerase